MSVVDELAHFHSDMSKHR